MNKLPVLIKSLLLIALSLSTSLAFGVIEDCDQSVNFSNGNTYKKISGTINCVLRDNPSIKTRSVSLRNGKKHGKTTIYAGFYGGNQSASNKVVMIENYHNGQKHGKFIVYDKKTWKVQKETDYKNNIKQREERTNASNGGRTISFYQPHPKGKWSTQIGSLSYNKAGQLSNKNCPKSRSQIPALNNVCGFNGKSQVVKMHDRDGKVTASTVTKKGKTQNKKTFYASGKLRSQYEPNLKQDFYENGKLKEEAIGNINQNLTVKKYYPSGGKKTLERSNKRILAETRSWYMNGKPKYVAFYQPKTRIVTVKNYYDNGQLHEDYKYFKNNRYSASSPESYSRSKLLGLCRTYYENGKLQEQSTYDNKGKLSHAKYYYQNGKIMQTVQMNADKTRAVKEYAKNGKLKKSATYYPDGSVKNAF